MIETRRLLLVPATERSLRAEIGGDRAALAGALGVAEPAAWPPELYDGEAMRYCLDLLLGDPGYAAWGLHYFALKTGRRPELIGAGGYKGAPRDGFVEIGYSVLPAHRRQGYAAEAAAGLVAHAFAATEIERVLAHTLPELVASIGVLRKLGFSRRDETLEEGAIMFALERADWRGPGDA